MLLVNGVDISASVNFIYNCFNFIEYIGIYSELIRKSVPLFGRDVSQT